MAKPWYVTLRLRFERFFATPISADIRLRYQADASRKRWIALGGIADNLINIIHAIAKQSIADPTALNSRNATLCRRANGGGIFRSPVSYTVNLTLHLFRISHGVHQTLRLAQPTAEMLISLGVTHHCRHRSWPAELAAMGFSKWKTGGRIRYRDLQLET
jgi:hypothetical protein